MKNNRANRHNDRGFTLSEVLLTVAILVVLFALDAVPVSKMRRELRSFWPPVWRRKTRAAAT